jgi:hypothetical protein
MNMQSPSDFLKNHPDYIVPSKPKIENPDFSEIMKNPEWEKSNLATKREVATRFFDKYYASKEPNANKATVNYAKDKFFKKYGLEEPKPVEKPGILDSIGNEFHDFMEHGKETASGRVYRAEKDKGSGIGGQVGGFLGPVGGTLGAAGAGAGIGSVVPGVGTAVGGITGAILYGLGRGGTEDYQNQQDEIKSGKRKEVNYGRVAGHGVIEGGLNAVTGGEGGSIGTQILKRLGINAGSGAIAGGAGSVLDQYSDTGKVDVGEAGKKAAEGAAYGAVLGESMHYGGKVGGKILNRILPKGKASNPSITPKGEIPQRNKGAILDSILPPPESVKPKAPQGSKTIPSNFTNLSKEQKIQAIVQASIEAAGGDIEQAKLSAAQALLESGLLGKGSTLANKYNNLFGIKGKGSAGSVNMKTWEHYNGKDVTVTDGFRAYNNAAESFIDHEAFLRKNSRYKKVLAAKTFAEKARLGNGNLKLSHF